MRSVRSLRRLDAVTPVHLCVYGDCPAAVRDDAARLDVVVHRLDRYDRYLARESTHARALALYPTLHKLLSLRHLPLEDDTQLLFLDCDTYCLGPPATLFERYAACDWYAREEPGTRASRHGADREHVDEEAYGVVLAADGLRNVVPFNSGVWLMNNGSWRIVDSLRATFLDLVWRLLCGRHVAAADREPVDDGLRAVLAATMSALDAARALPYPSRNGWIVEQVALWLALARTTLTQGFFDERDVLQNGEFAAGSATGAAVVVHYFSNLEGEFVATL
jgi:hypothetical protein